MNKEIAGCTFFSRLGGLAASWLFVLAAGCQLGPNMFRDELAGQGPVTTASVPGGFYSREVARAATESGIEVLFNSEPTTNLFEESGGLIVGRYNVYRGMPAADAAALVSSPLRRWRQTAFWNAKKVAKTIAGPAYKALRQRLLRQAYAVESVVANATR